MSTAFWIMEERRLGVLPQGMKSMVTPLPRFGLQTGLGCLFDSSTHNIPWGLPWNTQPPHPGLFVCPIRGVAGNKTLSLGPLGIAGNLEQRPAAAGDWEPRNACSSLAFLGPTVLLFTGLHQAPLWASLLVHFIPL